MTNYPNPASFGRIDCSNFAQIPDHYTSSIWLDNLPSKPADYGSNEFHGRTHPDIIKVSLDRYTTPGDLVWDCFAGSGTTIDVCAEYDNPCIANDITPRRSDIVCADSRSWNPYIMFDVHVDLVICHPPYMDVVNYGDGNLSVPDLTVYLDNMNQVFNGIREALNHGRVLVLIIGVVYKDRQMLCLDYELMNLLRDFRLLGRVIRTFGETKGGTSKNSKQYANLWKYRRLKNGIWELNQDVVLFLQKVS